MENKKALEIIGLIPDKILDHLAIENKVDFSVKKLKGKTVFQLFLYGVLSGRMISLRILEAIFQTKKFQELFNPEKKSIKHSGLGMRFGKVDYRYFENIFQYLINSKKVDQIIFSDTNKRINVRKIDSTMVILSSKLLKFGLNDNQGKKSIKYSLEINQGIPVNVILLKDQKYHSEENALPLVVKSKALKSTLNIAIFDRGIQSRYTFTEFSKNNIYFISRLTNHGYEVIKELPIKEKETSTLEVISDQLIRFKNSKETLGQEFRLVIGKNKRTRQLIKFITNVNFLEAIEITELYRSRWEIETFFKFIKQELNFSHLLSRSENGIKVIEHGS